jgi:SET domain
MKKNVRIGESKIHGQGLIANSNLPMGANIGVSYINGLPTSNIGKFYNHSDQPNAISRMTGNKRSIELTRDIQPGEEITLNYRLQPELEQPAEGWKCGGKTY